MRKPANKNPDLHSDWLTQIDVDGPFLAYPVVKDMWPNGVDRLSDTDGRLVRFKQAFVQWQRAFDSYVEDPRTPETKATYDAVRRAWIEAVLDDAAEWKDVRTDAGVTVRSPGEQITVTATGALQDRDGEAAALLLVCEPTSGLRDPGLDGWAASDVDRLTMLLRKAQVEVGIVTDGQWWALVWAKDGKPTGSGMVNALTWAEEPLLRDAFFTLINQRRFRALDAEQRLGRLFERSELEAEEITEALGTQVRRSVELLVQAFSEARLYAAKSGEPDPLAEKPDDVYQAAVTVMMRIVFLLFAEERDMLPTEQLYWDSYAIKDLLHDLRDQAAGGEENLDESYDVWHRLLAVSQALHGGVNYDEMRMPAYGGSLLDPDRFPWLHATNQHARLRLEVSDRVMLHVLESVQTVVAKGERRRISFREIDVEQIGYIYEGLLGYSCADVMDDVIVGLVGKDGEEPEMEASTLQRLYDEAHDAKSFVEALRDRVSETQPSATPWSVSKLVKLYGAAVDKPEMRRLLTPVAAGDNELLSFLVDWSGYIRRDLRGIPLVIPPGGLIVVETPSRKNAGAHYTPRSLAEEVVLHALEPLVYEPGPLQTNDDNEWRLKSAAAILDLKVADIAAGSGAFLVAAARYLAARVVEAWVAEGMLAETVSIDADDVRRLALREVIARCLYGADINPMAVEMCKLSLWLVSMDKTKPFSFVDDKIFCGNSLLGLTSLDQLRYLHLYPKPSTMHQQLFVDIDAKIDTATQLRHELASPVEERDPMRSSRAKTRLLEQFRQATSELRLVGDGIVAAGVPLGGKPGRQLDIAFESMSWKLHQAFHIDGSDGHPSKLLELIESGLTPTVETDYERWKPLHWVVEAPDVMIENGGFDAVVGNPPFLGVKSIRSAIGQELRDYLANSLSSGESGRADYVIYFLLRAGELSRATVGLISTDSIGEGDSSKFGPGSLLAAGWSIWRADRSTSWPTSSAGVRVSKLWMTRYRPFQHWLDGTLVAGISASLNSTSEQTQLPAPAKLRAQVPIPHGFQGTIVLGKSLLVDEELAKELRCGAFGANVVPYLSGDDLVATPGPNATRWVLDLEALSLSDLQGDSYLWPYLEACVWPERQEQMAKYPKLRQKWWGFLSPVAELYREMGGLTSVVAFSKHSKHLWPVNVGADNVFSNGLVVYPTDEASAYGFLASEFHRTWAIYQGGSMLNTAHRYNPSRFRSTYPFPNEISVLTSPGGKLKSAVSNAMHNRQVGVTVLLNRVHDSSVTDEDCDDIRACMIELNRQTAQLHGVGANFGELDFVNSSNGTRFGLSKKVELDLVRELTMQNLSMADSGIDRSAWPQSAE